MAWDRYFAPFSYGLWMAVAISVCAITVCLALTNYGHESNQTLSLIDTVFYIPACFCQQGKSKLSYEFFLLSSMFPVAVLFFPLIPFCTFLIFSCHSYSSFYVYLCTAPIYWPNVTRAYYSHSSVFLAPVHSPFYKYIIANNFSTYHHKPA